MSEANFEDDYVNNESINSIKKQEYKSLRTLHRLNYNKEHYFDPNNMKCNTEPSADFISNSTASFESSEFLKLNSQPFIPKSHTKQNSNNYFYRNSTEEDDYEE
jgi:hypothetical protein